MEILPSLRIVGWDIAITARGPVVIEANTAPDLNLIQAAERKGIADQAFKTFVAECARETKNAKKAVRKAKRAHARKHMRNLADRAKTRPPD